MSRQKNDDKERKERVDSVTQQTLSYDFSSLDYRVVF